MMSIMGVATATTYAVAAAKELRSSPPTARPHDMHLDDKRISVSLATAEFTLSGTRLIYTEQGAFFDGNDTLAAREQGTRDLLDALGTGAPAADDRPVRDLKPSDRPD